MISKLLHKYGVDEFFSTPTGWMIFWLFITIVASGILYRLLLLLKFYLYILVININTNINLVIIIYHIYVGGALTLVALFKVGKNHDEVIEFSSQILNAIFTLMAVS